VKNNCSQRVCHPPIRGSSNDARGLDHEYNSIGFNGSFNRYILRYWHHLYRWSVCRSTIRAATLRKPRKRTKIQPFLEMDATPGLFTVDSAGGLRRASYGPDDIVWFAFSFQTVDI
jgi:hypothetical protein